MDTTGDHELALTLDDTGPAEQRLRVRTPADLVIAVPYLLGFHPRDSLVLVGMRGGPGRRVELTARVDLPPRAHGPVVAAELAEVLAGQGCSEVVAVVVGGGRARRPRADLVQALRRCCGPRGLRVVDAVWVPEVAVGVPWRCYGPCGCEGVLADPAGSPVAAAAVVAGQVTYPDRRDLERLVAPVDAAAVGRRSRALDAWCDREGRRDDPVAEGPVESFALVRSWVRRAAEGTPALGDEDVVALCVALCDPMVRDAAFGLATGPDRAGAERLWTALVREAPDPEAAEPAVLLAHCAMLRGHGALMGIALDRAERAWPGHRLAVLFRCAVDDGLGVTDLAAWLAEGAAEAAELLRRRTAR
ncbi:MAG TPA: DUF4192 domain-containing protein [Pseudonocardia sp.]|jgi:hypothetical protein